MVCKSFKANIQLTGGNISNLEVVKHILLKNRLLFNFSKSRDKLLTLCNAETNQTNTWRNIAELNTSKCNRYTTRYKNGTLERLSLSDVHKLQNNVPEPESKDWWGYRLYSHRKDKADNWYWMSVIFFWKQTMWWKSVHGLKIAPPKKRKRKHCL